MEGEEWNNITRVWKCEKCNFSQGYCGKVKYGYGLVYWRQSGNGVERHGIRV